MAWLEGAAVFLVFDLRRRRADSRAISLDSASTAREQETRSEADQSRYADKPAHSSSTLAVLRCSRHLSFPQLNRSFDCAFEVELVSSGHPVNPLIGRATPLQLIAISFQRHSNKLAAGPHLGLRE
jgi:hypothetical protein